MLTIEVTTIINKDGTITAQAPPDVPPGVYHAIMDLEPQVAPREDEATGLLILDIPWPADLSLRREDMYGEWGR